MNFLVFSIAAIFASTSVGQSKNTATFVLIENEGVIKRLDTYSSLSIIRDLPDRVEIGNAKTGIIEKLRIHEDIDESKFIETESTTPINVQKTDDASTVGDRKKQNKEVDPPKHKHPGNKAVDVQPTQDVEVDPPKHKHPGNKAVNVQPTQDVEVDPPKRKHPGNKAVDVQPTQDVEVDPTKHKHPGNKAVNVQPTQDVEVDPPKHKHPGNKAVNVEPTQDEEERLRVVHKAGKDREGDQDEHDEKITAPQSKGTEKKVVEKEGKEVEPRMLHTTEVGAVDSKNKHDKEVEQHQHEGTGRKDAQNKHDEEIAKPQDEGTRKNATLNRQHLLLSSRGLSNQTKDVVESEKKPENTTGEKENSTISEFIKKAASPRPVKMGTAGPQKHNIQHKPENDTDDIYEYGETDYVLKEP